VNGDLTILRSLDPYHQRIGYLGALTTVAIRGLDTSDALRNRLSNLLSTKIYSEDPLYNVLMARLSGPRQAILNKLVVRRPERALMSTFHKDQERPWHYLSAFWLCDNEMPSPIGFIGPQKVSRIIDLAKWCGILRPTFELSESGYIIRLLLEEQRAACSTGLAFNLLRAQWRQALVLAYFRLLLQAETLWPYLICELVERSTEKRTLTSQGPAGLLCMAVERMIRVLGEPSHPTDALPIKQILDFRAALGRSASTAENYLRPRLELLVDLGLLERLPDDHQKRHRFPYRATEQTVSLATEMANLANVKAPIKDFMERRYFGAMARVCGVTSRRAETLEERLLWFAVSFPKVGRELGLTPGSTVANMGCLIAWEHGVVIEVEEMFDAVYEAKRTRWSEYLRMSGGSRFDREFVIRVQDGLIEALTEARPELKAVIDSSV